MVTPVYPRFPGSAGKRSGAPGAGRAGGASVRRDRSRSRRAPANGRGAPDFPLTENWVLQLHQAGFLTAHHRNGVNNYLFIYLFSSRRCLPPIPVQLSFQSRTQFPCESYRNRRDGRGRRTPFLTAFSACKLRREGAVFPGTRPPCPRVSGLWRKGQSSSGTPPPSKSAIKSPPRLGGALHPGACCLSQ